MIKIVPLLFTLLLVNLQATSQSSRNIPYPIIFVHGWNGSDQTWFKEVSFLKQQNLNVSIDDVNGRVGSGSRIDFSLNSDIDNSRSVLNRNAGPLLYGDVYDMASVINSNNDVFVINFENGYYSNQSGITKQGFAVGIAIKKVLLATGADKVILFGHSMGGLAIREYLQNPLNWLTNDNQHHVAKLITSGTPHLGSDVTSYNLSKLFTGGDELSEAVRDLRSSGIYLSGGSEANVASSFYNKDVDSNGSINSVTGLNQRSIYSNLEFACVIGTGGNNILGGPSGIRGDDVVSTQSANLFNIQYAKPLKGESFFIDSKNQQPGNPYDWTWHSKLPMQTLVNQYALDEPEDKELAFEIKAGLQYRGFLTKHSEISDYDMDRFKIVLNQRGILSTGFQSNSDAKLQISDELGYGIRVDPVTSTARIMSFGSYFIEISGNTSGTTSHPFNTYSFNTLFCGLPDLAIIESDKGVEICEGSKTVIKVINTGYDTYTWYRNGLKVGSGTSFEVDKAGTYYVEGFKCGVTEKSANQLIINIKPLPQKPTIEIASTGITSSAFAGNQWYHNGILLPHATEKTLSSISTGNYFVAVTENGCTSESDVFTVTGIEEDLDRTTIIYPNPSNGYFEIISEIKGKLSISMMDIEGMELKKETIVNTGHSISFNGSVKPGIYLLKIENAGKTVTKKIIIK